MTGCLMVNRWHRFKVNYITSIKFSDKSDKTLKYRTYGANLGRFMQIWGKAKNIGI